MTTDQIKAKFPNASAQFIRANATDALAHLPTPSSRSAMLETAITCQESTDEAKLNKTERAYFGQLQRVKGIAWIGVQCVTLKIGADCRYTPDFFVITEDGKAEAHEVKGFMREDALVKLKAGARKFLWIKFIVVKKIGPEKWGLNPVKP